MLKTGKRSNMRASHIPSVVEGAVNLLASRLPALHRRRRRDGGGHRGRKLRCVGSLRTKNSKTAVSCISCCQGLQHCELIESVSARYIPDSCREFFQREIISVLPRNPCLNALPGSRASQQCVHARSSCLRKPGEEFQECKQGPLYGWQARQLEHYHRQISCSWTRNKTVNCK